MNLEPNNDDERKKVALYLLVSILLAIALVALVGCKTVYVPQPVYHEVRDTIKQIEVRDSIIEHYVYEKDSSSFHQSGDTVRIEVWHWYRDYKYEKILQAKIDSLSHVQSDTVTVSVPCEVIREVEKPLKGWQKALIWWGIISLTLTTLYTLFRLRFAS